MYIVMICRDKKYMGEVKTIREDFMKFKTKEAAEKCIDNYIEHWRTKPRFNYAMITNGNRSKLLEVVR